MKKRLLALTLATLLGLSCATAPKPTIIQPTQEIIAKYNTHNFTLTRPSDNISFTCDYDDCELRLGNSTLVNRDFRNPFEPIVDSVKEPGYPSYERMLIDFFRKDSSREEITFIEGRFEKADLVYRKFAEEFKVEEHFQKWLQRSDSLDRYLE